MLSPTGAVNTFPYPTFNPDLSQMTSIGPLNCKKTKRKVQRRNALTLEN